MPDERPKRDWWQRGKAFDLWSIPHFLFGVITAFIGPLTGLQTLTTLILTFLLALAWEVGEKIIGIKESIQNILFDIVLPIAAFTLTTYLLLRYPLHPDDLLLVGSAFLMLYIYTNISGWLAYRRRNSNFTH
jgi:hypothetical protein